MHVVHLVSAAQLGGAETSVLEMAGSVKDAHPDWTIGVLTPSDGPMLQRLEQMGIQASALPFPRELERLGEAGRQGAGSRLRLGTAMLAAAPRALSYSLALGRKLGAPPFGPARVVHAHGFKMQVLAARAAPEGALLVWHVHDYVGPRVMSAWILRRVMARCSVVVANSESVASDVRRAFGPSIPIRVVYNAVDLRRFSPSGAVFDLDGAGGASAAPPGTVRVGLVGTFGRWKGHETFLRALSLMPDRERIRAYVIGGPVYRTAVGQQSEAGLRQLATHLGVAERLVFTGPIDDVASAMRGLDVVVHASTAPEPFGMVIAEGMACGRAVVASLAGGSAELVQDGVDGLGHAPGDAAGLAACLTRVTADPSLRRRLGAAARATAERRFDRTRLAAELTSVYLEQPA